MLRLELDMLEIAFREIDMLDDGICQDRELNVLVYHRIDMVEVVVDHDDEIKEAVYQ